MALTRTFLTGMGLTEEQVTAIIEGNAESLNGVKAERDKYKAECEKLSGVQKELEELKTSADDGKEWKKKFEGISKEYEAFKLKQSEKETLIAKEKAYRELLKNAGISEKRIDAVLKVTNIKGLELEEDGSLKDVDKISEDVKKEWSDFIVSTENNGARTQQPPKNDNGDQGKLDDLSMADYIAARKQK